MKKRFEDTIKTSTPEVAFICNEKPIVNEVKQSPYALVVKSPFGKFKKGDQIHDDVVIHSILGTHQEGMVLKTLRKVG